MADGAAEVEAIPAQAKRAGSEWFWRVLAAVMVVVIAWVAWIAYQLNPPQLVTNAAFEAAARARALRNAEGRIAGNGAEASQPPAVSEPPRPAEPREPPVNIDKLKMSDSLSIAPGSTANARAGK